MNKKAIIVISSIIGLILVFVFLSYSNLNDYLSARVFYDGQPFEGGKLFLSTGQGQPDENVSVNVVLLNSNVVAGFNLDIQYDTNLLQNPTATKLAPLSSANKELYTITPSSGVFRIVVVGLNQDIIPNDDLIQVNFAIKPGISDQTTILVLADLVATNINATQVHLDNDDGLIQIRSTDTTAPIRFAGSPTETLPFGTTQTTISLVTNENATCKYSTITGTNYDSISNTFSTTGALSHSTIASSLYSGNSYSYYVRCEDSSLNKNITDYTITFNISPASSSSSGSGSGSGGKAIIRAPVFSNRYEQARVTESEVDAAISSFSDLIKDSWYAPFIARMKKLSVLTGYPDGSVRPNNTINRAELAKISAKAFDLSTGSEKFTDVPNNAWFAPFIGALQKVNAIWTTSANYQPAGGVTRGEALWTLLTAAGINLDDIKVSNIFPDVSPRHRFATMITFASEHGIISGYDNGNFGPDDTLTRGQVAKIVTLIKDL